LPAFSGEARGKSFSALTGAQARIVDDHAFEVPRQARPAQVVGDHRRQAQAQAAAMIVREQAVAFDHHDVQAVMRVVEHLPVAAVQQVIEHALRSG
jgi:hypothetical protein